MSSADSLQPGRDVGRTYSRLLDTKYPQVKLLFFSKSIYSQIFLPQIYSLSFNNEQQSLKNLKL